MKRTSYQFRKLAQITFIACLLVITGNAKAQLDKVPLDPGYTQTSSLCPSVVTTANPTSVTDANGVTATDNVDKRAWSGSCNQQSEVFIAIDKNHPNYLLAGANTVYIYGAGSTNDQGYYYSSDGGSSWWGSDLYPTVTNTSGNPTVEGDPAFAFDMNGNGYMLTLDPNYQGFWMTSSSEQSPAWNSNPTGPPVLPTWSNHVLTDGRGGVSTNVFDKHMMAIDNMANSTYSNNIYVAGTQFTSATCTSISGGIVFYSNTTANATSTAFTAFTAGGNTPADLRNGADGFGQGANVQTGPNGEVYVCWSDYPTGAFPATNMGFAYSSDGGNSFPTPTNNLFTTGLTGQYTGGVDNYCGGADPNYGPNPLLGNGGTPGVHVTDFPAMAVDKSCGAYSGRIYMVYPEVDPYGSGDGVIALCYSCDHGVTWSQPKNTPIISNNIYTNVSLGNFSNFGSSFLPWITVDDITGIISVVYYQFDNALSTDPIAKFTTDTYVAYSSDGGNTFTNILVSDVSHINESIPGYLSGYGYIGNYIGITSYNGKAYAAWMDGRIPNNNAYEGTSTLWQLYISEIDYTRICGLTNQAQPVPNVLNINPTSTPLYLYQAVEEVNVPTSPTFQTISGNSLEIRAGIEVHHTNGFSATNELWSHIQYVPACIEASCGGGDVRLSASTNKGTPSMDDAKPAFMIQTKLGTDIKLGIFPNPTSGVVYLNLSAQNAGNLLVNLRDATGNAVMHISYPANVGANSYKLDLSNLNSGVYFINITDENGVTIKNDKLVLMGQ